MAAKRVCLYLVGTTSGSIRENFGTYTDWFGRVLADCDVQFVPFDGMDGRIPDLDDLDAVVISGSPASLTAPEPWMEGGVELIRLAYQRRVPTLGVCFGLQLMGVAFGGAVIENPAGWELSTYAVSVDDAGRDDPLFDGLPATIDVNLSHQDIVDPDTLSPLNGVRVLAANPKAAVQALAAGPVVRGIQFHPEFNRAITAAYIESRRALLAADADRRNAPADHPDQLLANVRDSPMGERILLNFIRHFVAT